MKIIIDKDMKNEALSHTKERIKYEYDRFSLSLEERLNYILIGTIGQLAFRKYLIENNIPFDWEFQAGKYDEMDFLVSDKIIEIKTSGYDETEGYAKLNMIYNTDQYERGKHKNYSYCVQIFINGYNRKNRELDIIKCNTAILAGCINFELIQQKYIPQSSTYTTIYKIPLNDLKRIDDIFKNH